MRFRKNSPVLLVFISLLLIPIWGLTSLDIETATRFSTFIGFLITLFLYVIVVDDTIGNQRYFVLVGPALYLVVYVLTRYKFGIKEFFFAPIPWLFLILTVWIHIKNHKVKAPLAVFVLASYMYSFHMYPTFERLTERQPDLSMTTDPYLFSKIDISDYSFLTADSSRKKINNQGEGFIVETWNEKCGPCISSIRDLEPVIDSLGIKHIFLYGNMGSNNLSVSKVYTYPLIKDKSKIYIDSDNQFLNDMRISSFPYLLFYNENGVLVDNVKGYHPSYLDDLKDKIIRFQSKTISKR